MVANEIEAIIARSGNIENVVFGNFRRSVGANATASNDALGRRRRRDALRRGIDGFLLVANRFVADQNSQAPTGQRLGIGIGNRTAAAAPGRRPAHIGDDCRTARKGFGVPKDHRCPSG